MGEIVKALSVVLAADRRGRHLTQRPVFQDFDGVPQFGVVGDRYGRRRFERRSHRRRRYGRVTIVYYYVATVMVSFLYVSVHAPTDGADGGIGDFVGASTHVFVIVVVVIVVATG